MGEQRAIERQLQESANAWRATPSSANTRIGVALVAGVVLGSSLMYLLDPRQGNRRRVVARDKFNHLVKRSSTLAGKTFRHMRNRIEGVISTATHSFRPEGSISDRKLLERVRSMVGRSIQHSNAVDFAVHDGKVIVRGCLKPHETGELIQALEGVPGIRGIDNQIVDATTIPQQVQ